jgi:hypothetical protein
MFGAIKNYLNGMRSEWKQYNDPQLRLATEAAADTKRENKKSINPATQTLQFAYDRAVLEASINRAGKDRPQDNILFDAIERQRATDPLVGPKLGKKEILLQLTEAFSKNDPKGVHTESLLCALGALAGYACQSSIFAKAVTNGITELYGLNVVGTAPASYFFGDPLNKPLAESHHSVWALAAGQSKLLGCNELPDINEIFAHVSSNLSQSHFGIPRFPNHPAADTPINYVRAFWSPLLPTLKFFCKTPDEWPILFGFAIQEAMELTKESINPRDALVIVMESAIPMSKVTF